MNRKLAIILAIVSIVLYSNTLDNDYAYDDFSVIKNNAIVTKGISAIPEIFSTPYRRGFFITSNDIYRPLSLAMFAAEYQLFEGSPRVGHLINMLFFAGCVILLFYFLDKLFQKKRTSVAFTAALLFALHPIHTEVVANIKSRDELLCFFMVISSVVLFIDYARLGKLKFLIFGSLLFFLSLLSKETSVTFIALLPVIFLLYVRDNKRRSFHIVLSGAFVIAAFLLIRYAVLHAHHADKINDVLFVDNFLVKAPTYAQRLATGIFILGYYLKLFLIPYPLISDYAYNTVSFTTFADIWVWFTIAVYCFFLATAIYGIKKHGNDSIAFGIVYFLVTISLFSNILFLPGAAIAERFLFLPSAGLCLVVAVLVEKMIAHFSKKVPANLLKEKRYLWTVGAIAIILGSITTGRNKEWADNLTLFGADVKKAPGNIRLNYFLGNELLVRANATNADPASRAQLINDGIYYLNRSLAVYPEHADAHRILGNGYFLLGRYDSAEMHLEKAIALNAYDEDALNNLDVVFFNAGKYNRSIETCKKILVKNPGNTGKYKNISTCYMHLGQYDSSIWFLKKGIAANTAYLPFYKDIALAYKLNNQRDSALKYQAIVQAQEPYFSVY